MPVRWTLHSSEVSTRPSKSAFFMMRRGKAEPIPRTTDLIKMLFLVVLLGDARHDLLWVPGMEQVQVGLDPVEQPVSHHVVAKFHCGSKTLVVGAAMALHHEAVEAEEHASVGLAHVQLLAHPVE